MTMREGYIRAELSKNHPVLVDNHPNNFKEYITL